MCQAANTETGRLYMHKKNALPFALAPLATGKHSFLKDT